MCVGKQQARIGRKCFSMQMMINCDPNESTMPKSGTSGTNNGSNSGNVSGSGMNFTTTHRFS